jgi:hypothetical protein
LPFGRLLQALGGGGKKCEKGLKNQFLEKLRSENNSFTVVSIPFSYLPSRP